MKVQTISRLLLSLALVAAPSLADYAGASGGNIAITFPSLGATLNQGQSYSITWTTSGITYPLVSIKLLSLTNGQPDSSNAITLSDIVQTSTHAYSWQVGQSFGGGNVIAIEGLTTTAYSASFSVVPATSSSSMVNSTMPSTSTATNLTSSRPASSSISSGSITVPPASFTTLPSSSISTTSSFNSSSGNSTDSGTGSSPANNPVPFVVGGIVVGFAALAGAVYFTVSRTRRRRRPVSMPLMVEDENENRDWSPPDWTMHNTAPSYRKPQPVDRYPLAAGAAPYAASYGPSAGYAAAAGYGTGYYADYADPAVTWASPEMNPGTQSSPTVLAVPEEAHIVEKTAVAVVDEEPKPSLELPGKPHSPE